MLRAIFGIGFIIAGIVGAGYIAIWWGIVEPILTVADAIDNDTVTASLVAWEVIKFFLKEIFAVIVGVIGYSIGMFILSNRY